MSCPVSMGSSAVSGRSVGQSCGQLSSWRVEVPGPTAAASKLPVAAGTVEARKP